MNRTSTTLRIVPTASTSQNIPSEAIEQIDDPMEFDPLYGRIQDPTGDTVFDAIVALNSDEPLPFDVRNTMLVSGYAGIRLLTRLGMADDGDIRWEGAPEHALLEMPIPAEGMPLSTVRRALWSAFYAEYDRTVAFYASTLAAETGTEALRHEWIVQEAMRCRTFLASLGLVPSTPGRSCNVGEVEWIACGVRHAESGWLEVSLKIDT